MPATASLATTRTATVNARSRRSDAFLRPAQVVASPETGLRYHIDRLLGQGGFGTIYRAEQPMVYLADRLPECGAVQDSGRQVQRITGR